jgi:hypothetical protein
MDSISYVYVCEIGTSVLITLYFRFITTEYSGHIITNL